MIRYGVPLIIVVEAPVTPLASESGIVVAELKTSIGVPFIIVVIAPGIFAGEVGRANIVAEGSMI